MPKISCLTITYNRLQQLKTSIQCYCDQSYPNRELVIVSDGDETYNQAVEDHIQSLARNDIRFLIVESGTYTLGGKRNFLLDAAEGDITCQWDDDDLYHPHRLEIQAEPLLQNEAQASYLGDQLQFFYKDRELIWSDWNRNSLYDHILAKTIPNTLMMVADLPVRYVEHNQHEDTAMMLNLFKIVTVSTIRNRGYLYVYACHDSNVTGEKALREIADRHITDKAFLLERKESLNEALAYYPLPKPYTVKARDHSFTVSEDSFQFA